HRLRADSRPLCRRRARGRVVLFQLSRRLRTDLGRGVRPHCGHGGGPRRQKLSVGVSASIETKTRARRKSALNTLTASEIVRAVASGEATGEAGVPACLRRLDGRGKGLTPPAHRG